MGAIKGNPIQTQSGALIIYKHKNVAPLTRVYSSTVTCSQMIYINKKARRAEGSRYSPYNSIT